MGIINTSPESYYASSIHDTIEKVRDAALEMESQGADFIDVGGASTAPYRDRAISEDVEAARVVAAVAAICECCSIPVSVDTYRSGVAAKALEAGALILNDITGLADTGMDRVISRYEPSLVLCAHSNRIVSGDVSDTTAIICDIVQRAISYGANPDNIVVDPAIGFFRDEGSAPHHTRITNEWHRRDASIIANLNHISGDYPILVSVSNKSFIGRLLDKPDPLDRMAGSLAAESAAVMCGADIIRTHHIPESLDAIKVASAIAGRHIA